MKTLALILFILIPSILISQDAPIKWKEIPLEDLQMTRYEQEPNAPALVLCDYEQIDFSIPPNGRSLYLFYRRHVRIKILTEDGLKYAKVSIPFHDMSCDYIESTNFKVIKGMVYNLDDHGKLKATKLKARDITYRDSTNCNRIAEFTLQDVKPGSVIEYSYIIPSLDLLQPKKWYFQHDIPVRLSEFRMKVPNDFEYIISTQNIDDFDIKEETYYNNSISTDYLTGYGYRKNLYNGAIYESPIQNLSGKQIRLVKKNIESFSCNSFINKPEDLMARLNIHLAKIIQANSSYMWQVLTRSLFITLDDDYEEYDPAQRTALNYPAGYRLYTLPDWDKFNSKLLNSRNFGLPLITFWDYQKDLNNILEGKISQKEKMLAIYDFIRKNIKWNKEYDNRVTEVHSKLATKMYTRLTHKVMKEKSLAEPFEARNGTNIEINFILIYLLNKAGIEASPVLVSTINNGKPDQNIPELKQFNQVLALVKLENEQLLLDATDSLRPFQFLDLKDLNENGFYVHGKDFTWIPISNNEISETTTSEIITLDTNMVLNRKTLVQETGYESLNHRKEIALNGKDLFLNQYKTQNLNSVADATIEIKNIENDANPLEFSITQSQNTDSKKEIKFQIHFKPIYKSADFNEEFRKFPIEFQYPFKKTYKLEMEIPNGYIAYLPKYETYSTFGGNAAFKYQSSQIGNKIELNIELQLLKIEFPALEYENLKELFSKINDLVHQQIVIKKIASI